MLHTIREMLTRYSHNVCLIIGASALTANEESNLGNLGQKTGVGIVLLNQRHMLHAVTGDKFLPEKSCGPAGIPGRRFRK